MDTTKKLISVLGKKTFVKILVLILLIFIGAILESLSIVIVYPFINLIANADYLFSQPVFVWLYESLGFESRNHFLLMACAGLLFFLISVTLYQLWLNRRHFRFIYDEHEALVEKLLITYMKQPYAYWAVRKEGAILRRISSDAYLIFNKVVFNFLSFWMHALTVIFIFLALFILDSLMTFLISLFFGAVLGIVFLYFHSRSKKWFESHRRSRIRMLDGLREAIMLWREYKLFGQERHFSKEGMKHAEKFTKDVKKFRVSQQIPPLIMQSVKIYSVVLVALVALLSNRSVASVLPLILVFGAAFFRVIPSINRMFKSMTDIRIFKPSLDAVFQDTCAQRMSDQPDDSNRSQIMHSLSQYRMLELRDVTFQYDGAKEPVIDQLSLKIPLRSKLAICGPPLSGKTTLGLIIGGWIYPQSGTVTVDGLDGAHYDWRKRVGLALKTPVITNRTIEHFFRFGTQSDRFNEESIWSALEQVDLAETVQNLPDKLNTQILKADLTPRQRKLMEIARVIYQDPDIIILDETTNVLDLETEKRLFELWTDKTIILITNKIKTIELCDQTIRFEKTHEPIDLSKPEGVEGNTDEEYDDLY